MAHDFVALLKHKKTSPFKFGGVLMSDKCLRRLLPEAASFKCYQLLLNCSRSLGVEVKGLRLQAPSILLYSKL